MDNATGLDRRGVAVSAACGVLLLLVFYPAMMVGAPSDPAVTGAPDPHEELRLFIGAIALASVASAVAVFAMLGWPILLGTAVDRRRSVRAYLILAAGYGLGVVANVLAFSTDL